MSGSTDASLDAVLAEIRAERDRQDVKWGADRELPILGTYPWNGVRVAFSYSSHGLWLTAGELRKQCDTRQSRGDGSRLDILLEEVGEAVEAATEAFVTGDESEVEKELTQIAAVCVDAIQSIRRRRAR